MFFFWLFIFVTGVCLILEATFSDEEYSRTLRVFMFGVGAVDIAASVDEVVKRIGKREGNK